MEKDPITAPRELPEYEIQGKIYLVDIEANELRDKADPRSTLSFEWLEELNGRQYLLLDLRTWTIYEYPWTDEGPDLPDYVIVLWFPPFEELDPVGYARKLGYEDDYFLKQRLEGKSHKGSDNELDQRQGRGI